MMVVGNEIQTSMMTIVILPKIIIEIMINHDCGKM